MNLTRFNRCLATVLFAVAGLLVAPPRAHAILGVGDTVFDPTMYATQLVQLQQATATVTNLAQQLQYEIRNTTGFAGGAWQPNTDFLGGLGNVIATEQGVSYTLTNLPTEFSLLFPGYTAPAGVPSQTAQQTGQGLNNTLATLGGTLQSLQGQAQNFAAENAELQQLASANGAATGRLQAIQIGNQIALLQTQQMQMLRQVIMNLTNATAVNSANQVSQQAQAANALQQFYGNSMPPPPSGPSQISVGLTGGLP